MYGFSEEIELGEIVGANLMWINLGHFIVELVFEPELRLTLLNEAVVEHQTSEISRWSEATGWTSTRFQHLLGKTVLSYRVVSRDELEISFKEDYVLKIYDNPQYESLHIYTMPNIKDDGTIGPYVV